MIETGFIPAAALLGNAKYAWLSFEVLLNVLANMALSTLVVSSKAIKCPIHMLRYRIRASDNIDSRK